MTPTPTPLPTPPPTRPPGDSVLLTGGATCAANRDGARAGQEVVVTCAGFQAAEMIDLYWSQLRPSAVVATFSADGSGKGMASFLAPEMPSGDHAVIIRGRSSARAVTVPVEIRAAMYLTPRTGDPGDVITADLTGFQPGETISIVFQESDNSSRVLRRVTAGEDGSVTTTFRAPTATPDSYTIAASGPSGASASASFEVT